ncbi:MAG: mandelate racemase/muconate lactonizing enzyme family protein [Pseudomonadota bacterium]
MKIENIETIRVSIPFDYGAKPSKSGRKTRLDFLLIKVDTDAGITGWGEAWGYNSIPATKAALETQIAPLAIGRDARGIGELTTAIQKAQHNNGRYGQTLFALSGLDIALWDIAAKAAGVPLYALLGGTTLSHLPSYASLLPYGDADLVRDQCAAAVSDGYDYVKLHERSTDAVYAARKGLGKKPKLMVDVNCPWDVMEAIEFAEAWEDANLFWLEEPVWPPENFEGLSEVRLDSECAIAAGENASTVWEFAQLFEAEAVDWAQPSVTKVGGITEMLKIFALAETKNVRVVPHSPYFGSGFLATLQIMAAKTDGQIPAERFYGKFEASLFGDLIDINADGMLRIPDVPGLGCDPDPDVIRAYRIE